MGHTIHHTVDAVGHRLGQRRRPVPHKLSFLFAGEKQCWHLGLIQSHGNGESCGRHNDMSGVRVCHAPHVLTVVLVLRLGQTGMSGDPLTVHQPRQGGRSGERTE